MQVYPVTGPLASRGEGGDQVTSSDPDVAAAVALTFTGGPDGTRELKNKVFKPYTDPKMCHLFQAFCAQWVDN